MELSRWLELNDARLDVVLEAVYDPVTSTPEWRCEITGISYTNGNRPATFIQTPSNAVCARALSPGDAFRYAVHKLRGVQLNVIYRSRNDFFTFPDDLTV